jgi:uncharacterized GH25 family protein
MKSQEFDRCRVLSGLIAGWVLVAAAHLVPGQAMEQPQRQPTDETNGEPLDHPNAAHDGQSADGASCRDGRLVITVRGEQMPISQATVKVTYQPPDGNANACPDGQLPPTDDKGQVVFSSAGKGKVKILVIAKGWETGRSQLVLKKGDQNETITLTPSP